MIDGVEVKQLATFPDERGFFREIVRSTEDIAREGWQQISHSPTGPPCHRSTDAYASDGSE